MDCVDGKRMSKTDLLANWSPRGRAGPCALGPQKAKHRCFGSVSAHVCGEKDIASALDKGKLWMRRAFCRVPALHFFNLKSTSAFTPSRYPSIIPYCFPPYFCSSKGSHRLTTLTSRQKGHLHKRRNGSRPNDKSNSASTSRGSVINHPPPAHIPPPAPSLPPPNQP